MSKLHVGLLAAGLCLGFNAAVAQNVDSEKDKAKAQQSVEQKDKKGTDAAGQTENSKFKEGKPQQSEADRGEKGRAEVGEKHFDQGKPGQSEATEERNTQTQPKQR
jgi:hypothetical protein